MRYDYKGSVIMRKITKILQHSRSMMISSFIVLALSLLFIQNSVANEKENKIAITESGKVINPGSDLWRNVRQRDHVFEGTSQIQRADAGYMIDTQGEAWRHLRVEKIIPYSAYLLAFTVLVILVFRLIRGEIKIEGGRSGEKILRFTTSQRFIHWVTAILFLILAITGLIVLLGRSLLLPVLGSEAFSAIAAFSKVVHNYCGPLFAVFLIFMLIKFIKGNFFNASDIRWFAKAGGMFGSHASSGRYNAGEKTWFWLLIIGGAVIVASGFALNFPVFELTKDELRQFQIFHVIAAVILTAVSIGHIFMATFAMEGALETMQTGYCDANWAKEHHDEWYEEMKGIEKGPST